MSLTRDAELALLIAEQEADNTPNIRSYTRSLDEQLGDEPGATTLHDFIGQDFFGEAVGTARTQKPDFKRVTNEKIAYVKYLRFKCKWSTLRIAAHIGVPRRTVRNWLEKPHHRPSPQREALLLRFEVAKAAYLKGGLLKDVAADLYAECGYSSPESCYQQLRLLFIENGVSRFRRGNYKHGRATKAAGEKVYKEYWREHNQKVGERRKQRLVRCTALTREGKRCLRVGPRETGICEIHSGPARTQKWTGESVVNALREWHTTYGRWPRTKDWWKAGETHPSFRTVYDLFGSWRVALEAAELIRRGTTSDRAQAVAPEGTP